MRTNQKGRPEWNDGGFTLIELLVTIGIIAVLTALTFGSYSKFKESNLRSVCGNNLRQLGVAATLYAADHDGNYPYTYDLILGINNPVAPGLIDLLGEYAGGDCRIFYCTDVIHCIPGLLPELTYQAQAALPEGSRFSVIGYNWLPSTSRQWTAPPQKTIGSSKRVLASCFSFGGGTVHQNLHNVLYADGHVEKKRATPNGQLTPAIEQDTLLFTPEYEAAN